MSKTAIGWIILLLIIVGGVLLYMKSGPVKEKVTDTASTKSTSQMGKAQSLKDLAAAGVPQKCTFTNSTDTADSNGVVYTGGGKMRGDFDSMVKTTGMPTYSHMISDGSTNYIWTSESNQGFKMKMEAMTSASSTVPSSKYQAISYDQQLVYKCQPWTVDASVFALPKDITFTDMNVMMKGAINLKNLPKMPQ